MSAFLGTKRHQEGLTWELFKGDKDANGIGNSQYLGRIIQ